MAKTEIINGKRIYLDTFLKKKLDNIKMVMGKEWDAMIVIDGIEGSGKSTLSFVCGWYITNGKLTLDNICEGTEDAIEKLNKLPDRSVLIIDEGSLMFSSKEVMNREQKRIIKIFNVIRQKKMCLIIVAPSFFELNKYISVDRSRFLLHVYTNKKLERGKFSYFGQKKKRKLYQIGKKNFNSYSKPKADFVGLFTNFDPFGEAYQELKRKSLRESFKEDEKRIAPLHKKWMKQRDIAWKMIIDNKWDNQVGIRRKYLEYGLELPDKTLNTALLNLANAMKLQVNYQT